MSDTASALVENESGELPEQALLEDKPQKPLNMSPGAVKLRSWLNKSLRIQMFDGRVLVGVFLCTDRDANVILGSCTEYLPAENNSDSTIEEPRMLGLVMVPGKHIQTVSINQNQQNTGELSTLLTKDINPEEVT
ncbi:N-alpha-acetyltransferase 38, NatC auxiliary subunit [Tribolium madens]|uniref:N-alpha-acetyltransferase 38, NatC auxiliary subunit n=1 Tax=Tribolium madens TaxID=41895 RepID=UPI001CF75C39|nr:N-alpha-acetyltransferase 38, NatC auxiliary subunit [Tribolium madens]XP_044255805.1 N-alpha-acetyltransferase 38, NatC auxiliary subunit [Tribolium madens]